MKICPKDLIGRDGNLVRMKVRPKDLIGWDGNLVPMKVQLKDLIGRDGNLLRMKVGPKGSDWLGLKSAPYEDPSEGSDWSVQLVCPARVI